MVTTEWDYGTNMTLINEKKSWNFFPEGWQCSLNCVILSSPLEESRSVWFLARSRDKEANVNCPDWTDLSTRQGENPSPAGPQIRSCNSPPSLGRMGRKNAESSAPTPSAVWQVHQTAEKRTWFLARLFPTWNRPAPHIKPAVSMWSLHPLFLFFCIQLPFFTCSHGLVSSHPPVVSPSVSHRVHLNSPRHSLPAQPTHRDPRQTSRSIKSLSWRVGGSVTVWIKHNCRLEKVSL